MYTICKVKSIKSLYNFMNFTNFYLAKGCKSKKMFFTTAILNY